MRKPQKCKSQKCKKKLHAAIHLSHQIWLPKTLKNGESRGKEGSDIVLSDMDVIPDICNCNSPHKSA